MLGLAGGEGEFVGWLDDDDNSLGTLYLSTAPITQVLEHTSRQGRQFTARLYLAASV